MLFKYIQIKKIKLAMLGVIGQKQNWFVTILNHTTRIGNTNESLSSSKTKCRNLQTSNVTKRNSNTIARMDPKEFNCLICHAACSSKGNLNRHLECVHCAIRKFQRSVSVTEIMCRQQNLLVARPYMCWYFLLQFPNEYSHTHPDLPPLSFAHHKCVGH